MRRRRTGAYREHLKSEIARDIIKGTAPEETAVKIGVSIATYYRYADSLAKQLQETYLTKADRIISDYVRRTTRRIQFLDQLGEAEGDAIAIKSAQEVHDRLKKTLQEIGYVPNLMNKSPQVLIQNNMAVDISKDPLHAIIDAHHKHIEAKINARRNRSTAIDAPATGSDSV